MLIRDVTVHTRNIEKSPHLVVTKLHVGKLLIPLYHNLNEDLAWSLTERPTEITLETNQIQKR